MNTQTDQPDEEEAAETYESPGDAPIDEPPPDEGDAGAEGIPEEDAEEDADEE